MRRLFLSTNIRKNYITHNIIRKHLDRFLILTLLNMIVVKHFTIFVKYLPHPPTIVMFRSWFQPSTHHDAPYLSGLNPV